MFGVGVRLSYSFFFKSWASITPTVFYLAQVGYKRSCCQLRSVCCSGVGWIAWANGDAFLALCVIGHLVIWAPYVAADSHIWQYLCVSVAITLCIVLVYLPLTFRSPVKRPFLLPRLSYGAIEIVLLLLLLLLIAPCNCVAHCVCTNYIPVGALPVVHILNLQSMVSDYTKIWFVLSVTFICYFYISMRLFIWWLIGSSQSYRMLLDTCKLRR